ncbi:unnamed protein product [Paramecium pentaurelia]|uniref:Uncharacterized protein n=1 Tax=Paramecium pentaurelia TaxID=43138 RepID=A0A8S1SUS5_9CILI|nr:unnamed protein product [Paramecium pentaurelia]
MQDNSTFGIIQESNWNSVCFALKCQIGYFIYMFASTKILPGTQFKGFPDPKGKVLMYKINGLNTYILTLTLIILGKVFFNFTLIPLIEHFWSFFIASNILAFVFSFILLIKGKLSLHYKPHIQTWTPQLLNDWWFGSEQNPRILNVDLKMYFYEPSLIGLQIFLLSFAEYQYNTYSTLSINMILFQVFWFMWLITHYIREDFMLSTWDIIAENFGFMLVWGDIVYLPYLYCIGGWYLGDFVQNSPTIYLIFITLLHVTSLYMYRDSNWQKDRYRRLGDKAIIWNKKPQTLQNKLLISGWWGIGRHLNYTGEILVYLSIAMCGEFKAFNNYILPLSLFCLLTHRATRDDKRCREKYGKLWQEYCQIAKFKIIPFIF